VRCWAITALEQRMHAQCFAIRSHFPVDSMPPPFLATSDPVAAGVAREHLLAVEQFDEADQVS